MLLLVVANFHRRSRKEGMITKVAKKCNFEAGDKRYEHEPESVLENEGYKILWAFSIYSD